MVSEATLKQQSYKIVCLFNNMWLHCHSMCQSAVLWTWQRLGIVSSIRLLHCRRGFVRIQPSLHQSLLQLSQVTYWFAVHILLHAAPNLVGRLMGFRSRLLAGRNSSEIMSDVSRCKNSALEHARLASTWMLCYCSYGNHADGSWSVSNFWPAISRQMNNDPVCRTDG